MITLEVYKKPIPEHYVANFSITINSKPSEKYLEQVLIEALSKYFDVDVYIYDSLNARGFIEDDSK